VFWFATPAEPAKPVAPKSFLKELAPLKNVQVWRFSLYYFFAFGGFDGLALWLPRYLVGVYGFNLETAGIVPAASSIPGSSFRAAGGYFWARLGARTVLYAMPGASPLACLLLSLPAFSPVLFMIVIFVLGFFMSLGKAAV